MTQWLSGQDHGRCRVEQRWRWLGQAQTLRRGKMAYLNWTELSRLCKYISLHSQWGPALPGVLALQAQSVAACLPTRGNKWLAYLLVSDVGYEHFIGGRIFLWFLFLSPSLPPHWENILKKLGGLASWLSPDSRKLRLKVCKRQQAHCCICTHAYARARLPPPAAPPICCLWSHFVLVIPDVWSCTRVSLFC